MKALTKLLEDLTKEVVKAKDLKVDGKVAVKEAKEAKINKDGGTMEAVAEAIIKEVQEVAWYNAYPMMKDARGLAHFVDHPSPYNHSWKAACISRTIAQSGKG